MHDFASDCLTMITFLQSSVAQLSLRTLSSLFLASYQSLRQRQQGNGFYILQEGMLPTTTTTILLSALIHDHHRTLASSDWSQPASY